jgi:hypothetical protein
MVTKAIKNRKNAAVNGSNDRRRIFAVPAVLQSNETTIIAKITLIRFDILDEYIKSLNHKQSISESQSSLDRQKNDAINVFEILSIVLYIIG